MFRRMMTLATRLLAPEQPQPAVEPVAALPEPEPAASTAPAPKATSWRSTSQGHLAALDSAACPDCGAAKEVGWYQCADCRPRAAS